MKNQQITLDSIALSEYGGLIQDVSQRLAGNGRKKFAKDLAIFLRKETITSFIQGHGIVSYINDLIELVVDQMVTTGRKFSHQKLGRQKTELEMVREITGNPDLSAEAAVQALIASGKLPTLGEFLKRAHQAGSGWHLTFIEVNGCVATVFADWNDGVLFVYWGWFGARGGWSAFYQLVIASGD